MKKTFEELPIRESVINSGHHFEELPIQTLGECNNARRETTKYTLSTALYQCCQ